MTTRPFAILCVAALLLPPISCAGEKPAPPLSLSGPAQVTLYDTIELDLAWNKHFIPIDSVANRLRFDAFDADNNGRLVRIDAIFSHERGDQVVVPAFAMKEQPQGPWKWKVRFAPRRVGSWTCTLDVMVRLDKGPASPLARTEHGAWVCEFHTDATEYRAAYAGGSLTFQCNDGPAAVGPIAKPVADETPHYFHRLGPGESRAWFFGFACTRPWVVPDDPNKSFSDEWIDRERELFEPMRAAGANILYQWMAPWELLLVHRRRAELWPELDTKGRQIDGYFKTVPIPPDADWDSYSYYDQGRASAMDRIFRQLEARDDRLGSPIYLMLAFLPHTCFQMTAHPWTGLESGWSLEDSWSPASGEKVNGFSGFRKDMSAYEFFEASPAIADRTDWRRQLWDWQANFFRYLIARWGASKSLGAWVLMDELEAVGKELGSQEEKTGWWGHPECTAWHDTALRFFRGNLFYKQGDTQLPYGGDPYGHLITSSAMDYDYRRNVEDNGTWKGGAETVDFFTYHSYPTHVSHGMWEDEEDKPVFRRFQGSTYPYGVYATAYGNPSYIPADSATWQHAARRLRSWIMAVGRSRPAMITESGYIERYYGTDNTHVFGAKYPSVFHYQAWAALMAGHASTPIDWNDGKEFGEMRWRNRAGSFERDRYPIDLFREVSSVRAFVKDLDLPALEPAWEQEKIVVELQDRHGRPLKPAEGECWALVSPRLVAGWVFVSAKPEGEQIIVSVAGLPPDATYAVRFVNTWTGSPIGDPVAVAAGEKGDYRSFDAARAILSCTGAPTGEVQDDQKDVAFVLQQQ